MLKKSLQKVFGISRKKDVSVEKKGLREQFVFFELCTKTRIELYYYITLRHKNGKDAEFFVLFKRDLKYLHLTRLRGITRAHNVHKRIYL